MSDTKIVTTLDDGIDDEQLRSLCKNVVTLIIGLIVERPDTLEYMRDTIGLFRSSTRARRILGEEMLAGLMSCTLNDEASSSMRFSASVRAADLIRTITEKLRELHEEVRTVKTANDLALLSGKISGSRRALAAYERAYRALMEVNLEGLGAVENSRLAAQDVARIAQRISSAIEESGEDDDDSIHRPH